MRSAKSSLRLRLALGVTAAVVLFTAAQAMASETIGDLVWYDANNNGMVDPGEPGIPNVVVNLYEDLDNNCVADGPPIRSMTTNASGAYLFSPPTGQGIFIVRIEAENFAPGGPLEGYISTVGAIPESGNVADDGKDHGTPVNGAVEICGVEIRPGTEPVGEAPTPGFTWPDVDENVQTTIDFGFCKPAPPIEPPPPPTPPTPPVPPTPPAPPLITGGGAPKLAITKRANRSRIDLGRLVTFTIRVRNRGTATATNLLVCDRIPARSVLVRARGASVKKGRVCWKVKKLLVGRTAGFQITLRGVSVGTIRNIATASASNAGTVTARANVRVTDIRGAARIPSVTG